MGCSASRIDYFMDELPVEYMMNNNILIGQEYSGQFVKTPICSGLKRYDNIQQIMHIEHNTVDIRKTYNMLVHKWIDYRTNLFKKLDIIHDPLLDLPANYELPKFSDIIKALPRDMMHFDKNIILDSIKYHLGYKSQPILKTIYQEIKPQNCTSNLIGLYNTGRDKNCYNIDKYLKTVKDNQTVLVIGERVYKDAGNKKLIKLENPEMVYGII